MSIREYLESINKKVFLIAYESNPIRKGWELHEMEAQNFTINDNLKFYDKYYLIDCYYETLTENQTEILWSYADGLMQKGFFNFMEGRTSLGEQINTSMTDWEDRFKKHEKIINEILTKRNKFIQDNGNIQKAL